LILAALAQVPVMMFRLRVDWGLEVLLMSLVIPVLTAVGVASFLWARVGIGEPEWSIWLTGGVTLLTLWIIHATINGLKSMSHREAMAFRKVLATARLYFQQELEKDQPA
jgi:hypothetical protein